MEDKDYYWPPPPSDFPGWMGNFSDFCEANASVIGFSEEEITWLKAVKAATGHADFVIMKSRELEKAYVNLRNIMMVGDPNNEGLSAANWIPIPDFGKAPAAIEPNVKARLDGMVKRVATCNDLTRDQKRSAGVLSKPRKAGDPNNANPVLKVKVVNGQAVLDCPLGTFKGYGVFVQDDNGPVISLGNSTARKYIDNRSVPEGVQSQQRTYFVQYVGNKNELVGNVSNKVTVAVMRVF